MEKEIALQQKAQQFQLKMMEMMNNLVNTHHSSQSFPRQHLCQHNTATTIPLYHMTKTSLKCNECTCDIGKISPVM